MKLRSGFDVNIFASKYGRGSHILGVVCDDVSFDKSVYLSTEGQAHNHVEREEGPDKDFPVFPECRELVRNGGYNGL